MRYGDITLGARMCWARLSKFCGRKKSCWPSVPTIAEALAVSERTIYVYLKELEDHGFISIKQRGLRMTNKYIMLRHQVFIDALEFEGEDDDDSTSDLDPQVPSDQERNTSSDHIYKTEVNHIEVNTPTPSEKVSPERIGRGWQDQPGLPKLSRLQRTQLITGAKSVSLTEEEMQLSFRGYRNSPWAQERGFPVRAWLKNPLSWIDLAEPIPGLTVADELFGQYIEIFKKAGVPIGDKEREDALKLWAPLTEDQKIGSGRDAIRYCAGREARYIKPPAKHLTEKPWTRVVEERTLPMVAPTGPLDKNAEMRRLARAKGHEVTI